MQGVQSSPEVTDLMLRSGDSLGTLVAHALFAGVLKTVESVVGPIAKVEGAQLALRFPEHPPADLNTLQLPPNE